MQLDTSQVLDLPRQQGDDSAQLLLSHGVDAQDLDEAPEDGEAVQATGTGSGLGSGLAHSRTSEPEPLLNDR